MKFKRKANTEIEASQFVKDGEYPPGVRTTEAGVPYVVTVHDQVSYVVPGDWIVAESDGEHYYPIKDKVFRATYEPVEQRSTDA